MARLFALNEEIVVRIHDPEPIYSWAVSSKAEQLAFNQWGRVRFPGSSPLKFMPPKFSRQERLTSDQEVAGSNPAGGSIIKDTLL